MRPRGAPAQWFAGAALAPAVYWLLPSLVGRLVPSYRDQGDFFFPLKLYTADRIRRGELPLWNPLSGMGEPWLANLQSGVLYPPSLAFLLSSPALAAGLFLLFHFGIGVWGVRAFLRQEGASEAAALAGAAAFAGSGFAASLSGFWNHFGAFAYLPGLAALARGGLARRRDRLLFAVLLALQTLSGSPEITGLTLVACAVLAWHSRAAPEGGFAPAPRLRLARLAAGAVFGLLLAAAALAPFVELALRSDRRAPLSAAERGVGSVGWAGVGSLLGRTHHSASSYLPSIAAGSLTLLLAAAGAAERERRDLVLALAAIGLAGLLLATAGPPGSWIRFLPILDRIRYPAKFLVLPAFSLSILAGLGLDAIRFAPSVRRIRSVAVLGAAGAFLILLSAQSAAVRITETVGFLLVLGLAWIPIERGTAQGWIQAAAALVLTASLALAGRELYRFAPEAELRNFSPDVRFLGSVPARVLTPSMGGLAAWVLRDARFDAATLRRQRESLQGYTNLLAGIRTIRTAAPLGTAAVRSISDTIDSASDPQRASGAASARVLWTPFLPPNMGSRKVGDFYRAPINPYRPRLSFAQGFRVETDPVKAWGRAASGESDWTRIVQLDRDPSPRPIEGGAGRRFAITSLAEDRPERVSARVTADGAGLLVMTDLAYPGWRAEVDGAAVPLLVADGFFRAVAIPAGAHKVDFVYRPLSVLVGAVISAAALVALVALLYSGEPRRPDMLL